MPWLWPHICWNRAWTSLGKGLGLLSCGYTPASTAQTLGMILQNKQDTQHLNTVHCTEYSVHTPCIFRYNNWL